MRYAALYLAGMISFVFIMQNVFPLTDEFALKSDEALQKPYLLLTSIFLHADLLHLGYNMIALALFGLALESAVGWKKFLAVFFLSGLAASAAAAAFYPSSLGASGAVSGIIGSLVVLRPRMTVFALGAPMPLIAAAAVWTTLDMLGVFFPSNIANAAHIAGLAAGALLGATWLRRFREKPAKRKEKPVPEKEIDEWEKKWMDKRRNLEFLSL